MRPHRSLLITGTLTEKDDQNPLLNRKYVYQRTKKGHGHWPLNQTRDLQRRRHVIPYNPQTPLQVQRRTHFANAIAAWHATTPTERQALQTLANARDLPAYQFFISRFQRTEPLPPIAADPAAQIAEASSGESFIFNGEHPSQATITRKTISLTKTKSA